MRVSRTLMVCQVVTVLAVSGLLVDSCGKNTSRLDGASQIPPATGVEPGGGAGALPPAGMGAVVEQPAGTPTGWTIEGTVRLAAELQDKVSESDVLFVTARVPGQRMPVAVERIAAPRFPVGFTLRTSHGTDPSAGPPASLEIVARLSKSGMAGPPQAGDLEGQSDAEVVPGATGVEVVLDTTR